MLPEGVEAKAGRIYYVSVPENCLAASNLGWHPNVGHAALVTNDKRGTIKQYDYGWFVGGDGLPPDHWLDLLWGGFPGADAPSVGTVKTVYARGGK